MKLARIKTEKGVFYAEVRGEKALLLREAPYEKIEYSDEELPLAQCTLAVPSEPGNIVAVGLNYRSHAEEIKMELREEPLIFSKWISSILDPEGTIIKPDVCKQLDYEAELAFVVKRKCRKIRRGDAADYILGYTCLNDVTARDLQVPGDQWARCKGFDTFCPFGPWVETEFDPENAHIRAILNGKVVQDGNTKDFIFNVYELLEYISGFMTLYPGDVVTTGTTGGIGPMEPGDEICVAIDGIGTLKNRIG